MTLDSLKNLTPGSLQSTPSLSHLDRLEAEAIHILREAVAEAANPVLLFLGGEGLDGAGAPCMPGVPSGSSASAVATYRFHLGVPVVLDFRDRFAASAGFQLIVRANEAGRAAGINPFEHGDQYTTAMRTEPLKVALDEGRFDVILGGARRDEERSRAKERIVSVRGKNHSWDPRNQRPELWSLYNLRLRKGETARVFPISNWTESDVLTDALVRSLELAPLYFASRRPTVERDGTLVVVDEPERMRFRPGESIVEQTVRFMMLGCWPVTGAIESGATDLAGVLQETLASPTSERQGRIGDQDAGGSLERQKREGYLLMAVPEESVLE